MLVPPEIIGDSPTRDITVREGDSVFLNCKAKGIPTPEVTWYRIHGGTDKRLCNLPDMKHVKGQLIFDIIFNSKCFIRMIIYMIIYDNRQDDRIKYFVQR